MQRKNILNIISITVVSCIFVVFLNIIYDINKYNEISSSINIKSSYMNVPSNRIVIESLNINVPILEGIEKSVLDKNAVGLYTQYSSFDDNNIPIILAGHNNKEVFKNLYNIKINDDVDIIYDGAQYLFKVEKIFIVSKDDTDFIEDTYNEKKLILITCKEKDTRFIVICNKL